MLLIELEDVIHKDLLTPQLNQELQMLPLNQVCRPDYLNRGRLPLPNDSRTMKFTRHYPSRAQVARKKTSRGQWRRRKRRQLSNSLYNTKSHQLYALPFKQSKNVTNIVRLINQKRRNPKLKTLISGITERHLILNPLLTLK